MMKMQSVYRQMVVHLSETDIQPRTLSRKSKFLTPQIGQQNGVFLNSKHKLLSVELHN